MTDKKYTLKEVLEKVKETLIKKTEDIKKSEEELKKSKEDLKGINKPAFTHLGTSEAGLYGTKGSSKEAKEYAKDSHNKVLNELKDQKKPNLPKSEDSSLKEFLKKKKMNKCGEMSKEEGAGPGMAPGGAPKQPKAPTMPKQPKVNQGY